MTRTNDLVIAHVVFSFDKIGGLENGVINIINNLNDSKIKHVICSLKKLGEIQKRVTNKNVSYYELNKNEGNDLSIIFKLYKIFNKEKVSVVHLRNWVTMVEGFLPAKLLKIQNIIYSEHGRHFEDLVEEKRINTIVKKIIFNRVDRLVSVSSKLADEMIDLYQIERPITVIQNGVDTDRFTPDASIDQLGLREELGISDDDIILGSVARLDKGKNYLSFFTHFLTNQKSNVKFILAGDGPEFETLNSYIQKHDAQRRIFLLGARDDIPYVLRSFDIFILPSLSEGLSNVLLEALATGLPLIAFRVGGNIEVVDEAGGILVELQNEIAFQNSICSLTLNKSMRKEMGMYNREKAVRQFSLNNMIAQYCKLYKNLN